MKNRILKMAGVILALMTVNLYAGGSQEVSAEISGAGEERVLRLDGGDWGLPNPYRHYNRGPGIYKMHLVYDSLLEIDEKGYIPWLAKDWSISDDGKTYTFTIQEAVTWHDGAAFTVDDVVFTFNYYREHPPVNSSLFPGGKYIVQEVEAVDNSRIAVTVTSPGVSNLGALGGARVIPRHVWANVEDPTAYTGEGATVGCGPFVLDTYNSEQGLYRFRAFDSYWGLKQAFDVVDFIPVSDKVLAFENHEIAMLSAPADLLSRYQDSDEYNVNQVPSYHAYRLILNMNKQEEFLNRNLRQALAYGINRKELVEKVQRGSGVVGSMGYLWKNSDWYNPDIPAYDYNPEKARELLKGQSYSFTLLTGNSGDDIKAAEIIKLNLEKIGINVTVQSVESKVRDNNIRTDQYEMLLVFYGGMGGDPDCLRSVYYSDEQKNSMYSPGYTNDTINSLAMAQAQETDPAKRKDLVFELQNAIATEVPMVILSGTLWNIVHRPSDYDHWVYRFDHNMPSHNKLSYLVRE